MAIYSKIGDITLATEDCIISAANTVGVMGKGVAKAIKTRYPWCYHPYKKACANNEIEPGDIFVVKIEGLERDSPIIIHAATKKHWRNKSKIEWVIRCFKNLRDYAEDNQCRSMAVPKLGCGLGGLDWKDVEDEMESIFVGLDCEIVVYSI